MYFISHGCVSSSSGAFSGLLSTEGTRVCTSYKYAKRHSTPSLVAWGKYIVGNCFVLLALALLLKLTHSISSASSIDYSNRQKRAPLL